jgi:hypothetical protein
MMRAKRPRCTLSLLVLAVGATELSSLAEGHNALAPPMVSDLTYLQ